MERLSNKPVGITLYCGNCHDLSILILLSGSWSSRQFFRITQYIGDTHNARSPLWIHARKPYPSSIFEDCADKSSRLTKSPQAPRCRRERHLPLKAQMPLNPEKFAPTGSWTQNLRCYRGSCNHQATDPFAIKQAKLTLGKKNYSILILVAGSWSGKIYSWRVKGPCDA
jgi:hypothetical protein